MPHIDSRTKRSVTSLMNAAGHEKREIIPRNTEMPQRLMILLPLNPTLTNQSMHLKLVLLDSLAESSDEGSGFQSQGCRLIDLNKFSSTHSSAYIWLSSVLKVIPDLLSTGHYHKCFFFITVVFTLSRFTALSFQLSYYSFILSKHNMHGHTERSWTCPELWTLNSIHNRTLHQLKGNKKRLFFNLFAPM